MIIGLALTIMITITFLGIILGNDLNSISQASIEITDQHQSSKIDYANTFSLIELDDLNGAIIILFVVSIVVFVAGFKILGSGFGDEGGRSIGMFLFYGGFWALLTVLAWNLINSIEVFGYVIYLALTFGYVAGIIQNYYGVG